MPTWIDFRELRAKLRFENVLRRYKIEINRKGEQHSGPCPLPNHQGATDTLSFSANLERGIFRCFGCGKSGNLLEFAALMEGIDPKNGSALREIGESLQADMRLKLTARPGSTDKRKKGERNGTRATVNAPLDFELKGLEHDHPFFAERGISIATAQFFGIGFCTRGLFRDRIAVPLHDRKGSLIGYAGRVVKDTQVSRENPKYLFPRKRERGSQIVDFYRDVFLYNGNRICAPVEELVIVDDFDSVWWLHEIGVRNVAGSMASCLSEEQLKHVASIVAPSGRVILLTRESAETDATLSGLSKIRFTRLALLAEGEVPSEVPADELLGRLND